MNGSGKKAYLREPKQRGYLGQTIRTLAFHDVELKRCSYKDPMTGAWKGRWVESKYPAYSVWTKGLDGWRHYIERTIDGSATSENVEPIRRNASGEKSEVKRRKRPERRESKFKSGRERGGSQVQNVSKPGRIVMRRKGKIQELPEK